MEAAAEVAQGRVPLVVGVGALRTDGATALAREAEAAGAALLASGVALDRRTRMLHDARHVFINGESYRAAGRDARLMRRLADERRLDGRALRGASAGALELLADWCGSGWVHPADRPD